MKIIEEQFLHNNYIKIQKFIKKYGEMKNIYENIDNLDIFSVQKCSIENDIQFFDEVSFILSVITSIVNKPRLITKQDETVIRSELCPSLQIDSFKKTMRDSRMWKQKGIEMLPKEVFYNESIDEIATYENKFVVKLVDIIDIEINKYLTFYMTLLKSYEFDEDLLFETENMDNALNNIKKLDRRIKFIKATYFYRTVKKQTKNLGHIVPTNILLKNRLYNYCFKFYRKYISIDFSRDTFNELRKYYLFIILKCFKKLGYNICKDGNFRINKNYYFRNDTFKIRVLSTTKYFKFTISNKYIRDEQTTHLLLLDINNDFSSLDVDILKEDKYTTKEAINIFKLCEVDIINDNIKLKLLTKNIKKEEDLILYYIKEKTQTPKIQSTLYERICPVCRGNDLVRDKKDYICRECNSIYTFYNNKKDDYIYFKRIRRKK